MVCIKHFKFAGGLCIRINCPALGTNCHCVFQLLISPLQASSLFAECDKVGRLCHASASFLIRAGEDNAFSIPGCEEDSDKAANPDLSIGQKCLGLRYRCLFSQCSFVKMAGLRVCPNSQESELLLPFLRLIKVYKHSCSLVLQRSYLDTDTVPLGASFCSFFFIHQHGAWCCVMQKDSEEFTTDACCLQVSRKFVESCVSAPLAKFSLQLPRGMHSVLKMFFLPINSKQPSITIDEQLSSSCCTHVVSQVQVAVGPGCFCIPVFHKLLG